MTLLGEELRNFAPHPDASQGVVSPAESMSVVQPPSPRVRGFLEQRDPIEVARGVITEDARLSDKERELVLADFTRRTEGARVKDFLPVLAHRVVGEAVRAKGTSPRPTTLVPQVTEASAAPRSRRFSFRRG